MKNEQNKEKESAAAKLEYIMILNLLISAGLLAMLWFTFDDWLAEIVGIPAIGSGNFGQVWAIFIILCAFTFDDKKYFEKKLLKYKISEQENM